MINSVNINSLPFFLDTSVLIELVADGSRKDLIYNFLDGKSKIYCSILSTMFTFRHNLRRFSVEKKDNAALIEQMENNFIFLDFTSKDYSLAKKILKNSDFEDAIQIASCLNAKVDNFVTIDKGLQKLYGDKVNIILVE